MKNSDCGCTNLLKSICSVLAVASSIIIGIVAGFLRYSATITVSPAFLWTTFGIAVLYLLLLVFNSNYNKHRCIRNALPILLTGIFGTILTSLVLLAITFVATSVAGAIITGLNLAAFSLTLTSSVCLIHCTSDFSDD